MAATCSDRSDRIGVCGQTCKFRSIGEVGPGGPFVRAYRVHRRGGAYRVHRRGGTKRACVWGSTEELGLGGPIVRGPLDRRDSEFHVYRVHRRGATR